MAITQYAPIVGGAERQAQAISEALVERGVEVAVLTQPARGAPQEETLGGVRVLRRLKAAPLGPLWGLTFMWSVHRELRRLEAWADVIHCHQVYLHAAVAARRRKAGGPPVVCKAVGSGPRGDLARLAGKRGGSILMRWARRLDRVIATSAAAHKEFLDRGFRPEQVARIPNLVDTERFRPAQAAAASPEWLFVGRLHPVKGADLLLKAFAGGGALSQARLALVGAGPQAEELKTMACELGLADRVRFLGETPDPRPFYAQAKGVVLPSRSEGLSNVLLEALACGKPVIATDVGGTREVLEGAEPLDQGSLKARGFAWARHGILVRPSDPAALAVAIEAAEAQPQRSAQCAQAGRALMESNYSKDAVLDKLLKLYEELLSL